MGWPQWNPAIGWWLLIAAGVALDFVIMGLIGAGVAHWVVIIVTMGLIAAGVALWVVISCVAKRFRDAWPRERLDNGNGIRVGAPKVYDNRSLALMIEQLEKQLQAVKSIDEGTLKSAIGTQQGERRTDWTGTLDAVISAPPNTNAASAKGKPAAESGSGKPASAAPKDLPSLPSDASPFKWSEPARYLLSEQVSLYYEIFNLRLLLERALSDRLRGGKTRLQAVIGVPISLDPPPYASGCAATVELKIATKASLVALFPQQETFNTWGVDRRRFQLSAAGSAEKASGSGTLQAARQTSFLRRHAEVVAMERESGLDELVVAWQFRPAPGARTVAPGLRQMLMVIALPDADADTGDASITMELFVRSSWQKWREHSETAGSGPGWHAILSKRTTHYDEWGTHGSFEVPTTEFVERSLAPVIDSIEWARIGAAKAAIIVRGKNFFTGTTVLLGDEIIDAEHGLTIKSERSIQVIAPLESLTRDAVLSGRYGPSFRLLKPRDATLHPMHITGVSFDRSPSGDSFAIKLSLSTRNHESVNWEVFKKLEDPIFCINRKLVPDLLVFDPPVPSAAHSVQASVWVTGEFLPKGSALFILRWPFLGDDWSLHYQTYGPGINVSAFRFDNGEGHTGLLFSSDAAFGDGVFVVLDRSYSIEDGPLSRLADDLLKLELSADLINSHCECFICQHGAASLPVAIPDAPPAAEPSVDTSKRPPLLEPKTAATVDLMGAGLEKVVRATLNGTPLLFQSYAGGASAFVVIEGKAVPSEGKHAILLETQSGKKLSAPILIKPRPEPKNGH